MIKSAVLDSSGSDAGATDKMAATPESAITLSPHFVKCAASDRIGSITLLSLARPTIATVSNSVIMEFESVLG
jgi:hypothetical protein